MSQNLMFNQLEQLKHENIGVKTKLEQLLDMAPSDATLKGEIEETSSWSRPRRAHLEVFSQHLNVAVTAEGETSSEAFHNASRIMEAHLTQWLRRPNRLHRPDRMYV